MTYTELVYMYTKIYPKKHNFALSSRKIFWWKFDLKKERLKGHETWKHVIGVCVLVILFCDKKENFYNIELVYQSLIS